MNTMIFSQAGQSAGIGFAVPYTIVERVVTQVIEHGRVSQVGLGIRRVEDQVARRAGIDGVAILDVRPGTPAAKAGLRGLTMTGRGAVVGDVIVKVDDTRIHTYDDLYNALDVHAAGDVVTLTLLREGKEVRVEVPLVELAED
jgi:S1-C subfamily serine protease